MSDSDNNQHSISDIFSDINEYQNHLEESTNKIKLSTIEYDAIQDEYTAYSQKYMETRRINGKSLQDIESFYFDNIREYIKKFNECIEKDHINAIDPGDLAKVELLIMFKLNNANKKYREAKSKYNMFTINAAVRYVTVYDDVIKTDDAMRNITKEKIKMIAEARNINSVISAMLAKEEMEIYQSIFHTLKTNIDIVKSIIALRNQDIQLNNNA